MSNPDDDKPLEEIETEEAPEVEPIPEPEGETEIIETEYDIGQDNFSGAVSMELDIHKVVFSVSAIGVMLFVFLTLAFQNEVEPMFIGLRDWLTSNLDWFFLASGNIFVLVCLGLVVSPLGKVRLGGPEATPDFGYIGWFSMLFAAGMGIGLMFFGVSEPMSHYSTAFGGISVGEDGLRTDWAPLGGAEGNVDEARRLGMAATIFHWGLHPWAIYAVVALALALFSYNKGLPLTLRSAFYPIFGERVWGWPGHVIDILAVFATVFGLATSLGIGAQQAAAGLNFLFGLGTGNSMLILLIIVITLIAIVSIIRGLEGGVKVLSEVNMGLAALLLAFVVFAGPTLAILTGFFDNLLAYGRYLPELSMPFGREDSNFAGGWTAFYWAWWISWSPFVGMFIARVSRGRSVREFITCVLLIPTIVSAIWMTVFGGTGINQIVELVTESGVYGYVVDSYVPELSLFGMLADLPLASITSTLAIILVIVFFVTSSDSGSLVIDTITAGGKINAPVSQRVFWVIFEGVVAAVLLIGGGLAALQAASVSTGLPFAIVLLLACYALVKGLMAEPRE